MKNLYFVVLCCLLGFTTSCSDDDNATALLQIDPSTDLVFEAVGGTRTIEVKTDQATWQVESNQAWCKVAQSDGTHFTVTAEENTASEPKPQAVVTVTAGTAQAVLKVDQKGTETPPVTGTTFKITLGEPTPTGVNMKVVPSDNDAVYYYDVLSKQILDQHHSGDLAVYMKNMMAEAVKNYGSVEEALKKLGSQGESNYAFEGLDPNTDYLAFAAGLDAAGEVNTAIEKTTFKTKELAAGATFKVEFTCYYNGADFTITPSDLEFPYYSAIRPAFRYQGLDDDALLQTIIAEDSFMLDFMAAPGVYEYKNEGVYLPDTEYWVLIFGWAASAPTTPIQKFPFRTSKPNIDPAACQFTVTQSDPFFRNRIGKPLECSENACLLLIVHSGAGIFHDKRQYALVKLCANRYTSPLRKLDCIGQQVASYLYYPVPISYNNRISGTQHVQQKVFSCRQRHKIRFQNLGDGT